MPLRIQRLLTTPACLVTLVFAVFMLAILPSSVLPGSSAAAAAENTGETDGSDKVFKQLEKLLGEYYPKAKITRTANSMHFEYKLKSEIGFYSARPVMAPQDGGILGDLSVKPGEYAGDDKGRLPAELPDGFHTSLRMAPYSSANKDHLLTLLTFPSDAGEEFKSKFKEIVSSFAPKQQIAAAAPVPTNDSAAVPAQSPTPVTAVPSTAIAPLPSAATTVPSSAVTPPQLGTAISAATPPMVINRSSADSHQTQALQLFSANGTPIGGANMPNPIAAKSAPAKPASQKPGSLPADFVEFKGWRYLPAYPSKVRVLKSRVGANGRGADLTYLTLDSYKTVYANWTKKLEKNNFVPSDVQVAGQIRMETHVPLEHPNQFVANTTVCVTIKYALAQGGGTIVEISYEELGY